jgi:hypothetical protein
VQGEETMKLGDTIYVYSPYNRHEKSLEDHLARWREYRICEETRVSWIAKVDGWAHSEIKIDKKTEKPRGGERIAISRAAIEKAWEDDQWISHHAYRIADKVKYLRDVDTIRKVAELVGYDPKADK